MSKISIDEVESTLLRQKIEPEKVHAILHDLRQIMEELQEDKEKEPKEKWEFVIVLDGSKNKIPEDIAGWVVQQKEGEDAGTVLSRLSDAAKDQNETANKKKVILQTMRDIFSGLKSKFLKPKNIKIKTKELTRVVITK